MRLEPAVTIVDCSAGPVINGIRRPLTRENTPVPGNPATVGDMEPRRLGIRSQRKTLAALAMNTSFPRMNANPTAQHINVIVIPLSVFGAAPKKLCRPLFMKHRLLSTVNRKRPIF
jgi:hypothetical protein